MINDERNSAFPAPAHLKVYKRGCWFESSLRWKVFRELPYWSNLMITQNEHTPSNTFNAMQQIWIRIAQRLPLDFFFQIQLKSCTVQLQKNFEPQCAVGASLLLLNSGVQFCELRTAGHWPTEHIHRSNWQICRCII